MTRRTKIVATIGPVTEGPAQLDSLIAAGMDVARVSLSHRSLEEALVVIADVRSAARRAGRFIGVLADLPGPKVRAAEVINERARLDEGAPVELVPASPESGSTAARIAVDHASLLDEIQVGDLVALGDGAIQLMVEDVSRERAVARVMTGGWMQGRPGVTLPARGSTMSSPTPEDLRLLAALVDDGVDAVAVSFVRGADDVESARAVRPAANLIAKIETAEAVDALPEIIAVSDGVMVARGDLGMRCALEDVPHHQKRIIRTGVAFGRPVITATQMLESMLRSPIPTRAEVSDIANAVFDGTSALMLSAETAIGEHPVLAVKTMSKIAERAEREFDHDGWGKQLGRLQTGDNVGAAVSAAAWRAATDAEVTAIIACTNTGATARAISRFRPTMPVLAATPSESTARQLSMAWGITPLLTDRHGSTDDIVWFAVKAAVDASLISTGDLVAVLVGSPIDPQATTDTLRLVRVH